MKYLLRCKSCGATCWAHGWDEPDVNAITIDDSREMRWEPASDCPHDEYDVIDQEYPEP